MSALAAVLPEPRAAAATVSLSTRQTLKLLRPGESVLLPLPSVAGAGRSDARTREKRRINQWAWYLWGPGRYWLTVEAGRWVRVRRV